MPKPQENNHKYNPHYLNGFKAITLMVKVVEAINTVAIVTKLSVCKAVTISERLKQIKCKRSDRGTGSKQTLQGSFDQTYSLRHCDLVQLQGFRGLEVVSDGDKLQKSKQNPHYKLFYPTYKYIVQSSVCTSVNR